MLIVVCVIVWAVTSMHCCGQTLVDQSLYASDITIRVLDASSTHKLLNAPCKCFAEADPVAPGGKGVLPILLFQAGMSGGTIAVSRFLEQHHHTYVGRVLVIIDVLSEVYVVQHNMHMNEPPLSRLSSDPKTK
jgi:hypothetical protein